jgi:ankyrin repeat protein
LAAKNAFRKEGVQSKCEIAEYGATPLHYAAWEGCKEVVCLLLDIGANMKLKDKRGILPAAKVSKNADTNDFSGYIRDAFKYIYVNICLLFAKKFQVFIAFSSEIRTTQRMCPSFTNHS